ncbi:trypsin zeta-like [Ceratitis capitata]|uniref:trypsin zeta-like n=1 Tax=Ceratitis capitata TaxID=7213 RepID=UPI0003298D06|nr:trypsin zeta-like [Ceratitis capitata]
MTICALCNYIAFLALSFIALTYAGRISLDELETISGGEGINGRIVGGKVVDIRKHPHQISLRQRPKYSEDQSTYAHNCGGTIYTDRIVITAGHCLYDRVKEQLMVVAGANERSSVDGAISPVQEIIMHEEYNDDYSYNDIALLVLTTPLPINNVTIKAATLTEVQPQHGDIATITGWGTLSSGGSLPDLLQEVQVPIVSNEICSQRYPRRITDAMICAGILDVGGKDACQMDSGGPLLIHGQLAGVVSFGSGCALPQYPGVYANVWYFSTWIREKAAQVEAKLLREN